MGNVDLERGVLHMRRTLTTRGVSNFRGAKDQEEPPQRQAHFRCLGGPSRSSLLPARGDGAVGIPLPAESVCRIRGSQDAPVL